MATAITLFIGRLGSLFGNSLFGLLIDDYCDVLILIMAAQLFSEYIFSKKFVNQSKFYCENWFFFSCLGYVLGNSEQEQNEKNPGTPESKKKKQ